MHHQNWQFQIEFVDFDRPPHLIFNIGKVHFIDNFNTADKMKSADLQFATSSCAISGGLSQALYNLIGLSKTFQDLDGSRHS